MFKRNTSSIYSVIYFYILHRCIEYIQINTDLDKNIYSPLNFQTFLHESSSQALVKIHNETHDTLNKNINFGLV